MKYIAISQPGGPEVLQIREGEIPTIGEHEVLIEVKAAGRQPAGYSAAPGSVSHA